MPRSYLIEGKCRKTAVFGRQGQGRWLLSPFSVQFGRQKSARVRKAILTSVAKRALETFDDGDTLVGDDARPASTRAAPVNRISIPLAVQFGQLATCISRTGGHGIIR